MDKKFNDYFYCFDDGIYLNSAGTTLKHKETIEYLHYLYKTYNVNINRTTNSKNFDILDRINLLKSKIQNLFNAYNYEILFLHNATECINFLAESISLDFECDDIILTTDLEHHSNFIPWRILSQKMGCEFKSVGVNNYGLEIDDIVIDKVKILSFTHCSNVLGNVLDAKNILTKYLWNKETITILDMSQTASHIKIDLDDISVDFACCSAHKMFGPFGLGLLFIKKEKINILTPYKFGGGMVRDVDSLEWFNDDRKFYAGTVDYPTILSFEKTLEFILNYGIENISLKVKGLTDYLFSELEKRKYIEIYSSRLNNIGVISFNHIGIHPHDIAELFNRNNIVIRVGNHCAQPVMKKLKIKSCLRVSLHLYNDKDDIDNLLKVIDSISIEKDFGEYYGKNR